MDGSESMDGKNKAESGSDYLWDGQGTPEPDLQRLETALRHFRLQNVTPPRFASADPALRERRRIWWLSGLRSSRWAAAGSVCAAALVAVFLSSRPVAPVAAEGWSLEFSKDNPDTQPGSPAVQTRRRMLVGDSLETDAGSKATIAVAEIGRLEVEPGTRLRVLQSASNRKRIALERGTIHALIWAPPGQFVVDTPSATAVDLGCMYSLIVDDTGGGILRTTLGWVGFRQGARESFIPAGAACATRRRSGPGSPYFEDATEEFRAALERFDASEPGSPEASAALQQILHASRVRDAFTLWHLLSRTAGRDRAAVFDRLAALVTVPAGANREGILRLDPTMLDAWWNALDLGDISLWRHWERYWSDTDTRRR